MQEPLIKTGQGDATRCVYGRDGKLVYREPAQQHVDLEAEPTGATAAYVLIAVVLALGVLVGFAVGVKVGKARNAHMQMVR